MTGVSRVTLLLTSVITHIQDGNGQLRRDRQSTADVLADFDEKHHTSHNHETYFKNQGNTPSDILVQDKNQILMEKVQK